MEHEKISINQPTRTILLRAQEAQIHLGEFSTYGLRGNATKEESLRMLTNVIKELEAIQRAIEGEGKSNSPQPLGCSVMSYHGAV